MDSAINIPVGGVPQGDLSYLLQVSPAHQGAWDDAGTPQDIRGWLKVRVADADRWIALYETAPT
ncbi:unnamed protein product [marine sediment metagenome]|uniref:Uncharacterized protein n=1 Tax=marine sediment metagenome TaxID=412755 RepID=X1VI87_9ZZZZ